MFIPLLLLQADAFFYINPVEPLEQSTCWSYQCASEQSLCIASNPKTSTYSVATCKELSRPYCNSSLVPGNVSCSIQPKYTPSSGGYPGEHCSSDKDCKYGRCISQFCFAKVLNNKCSSHLECNPGLRCSKGICTTLLKLGKACSSDFDCVSSAGCNNGLCTEYYSLSLNKSVSDCTVGHQSSLFCESGSCTYDSKRKTGLCISGFKSKSLGGRCQTNSDCVGVSGQYSKTYSCECGMNFNGTKYCSASDGDLVSISFRNEFKNFINAGMLALCNTQRRFDQDCLEVSFDTYRYERLMKSYYTYKYFAQLQNISSCVKSVFFNILNSSLHLLAPLLFLIL